MNQTETMMAQTIAELPNRRRAGRGRVDKPPRRSEQPPSFTGRKEAQSPFVRWAAAITGSTGDALTSERDCRCCASGMPCRDDDARSYGRR